jgi:excisionase family DNA binding protein
MKSNNKNLHENDVVTHTDHIISSDSETTDCPEVFHFAKQIGMCDNGDKDKILTADEASFYLGISKNYLYKMVQLKIIPYHKPGGKMLLFLKSELVAWVCSDGAYKGISV